ncbi:MAG: ABC-3 protein [Candidatus Wolfebacteria bacterium GW2011_GWE2_44_13]|uniref:High-affinity zinc uptake system membrane protein ZnuB n=1 Tax=Candidatus Wolfebacteria bacterium GW2011_GWE2_44_13 TaxID=1619017 RepID=A0A0G1K4I4_9BACT|nr:MAG: ABC-3 protein [Candidatus Wolfebacteria bacterium GW2011_GWE2_44_13]
MTFDAPFFQILITAVFVAASAGLLGSFVILKRMALVGDALSHVALPGIALGLTFHINPFIGAFTTLFIAVVGIWLLKYETELPVDTLVGILFTSSLALGILFIPEQELLEALFGDISALGTIESISSVLLSIGIITALLAIHKKLALSMLSEELAHSVGIKNRALDFIYLFIFALSIALGIKFVGALLMGSLVIIPAAAAKNISRSLHGFMLASVSFGVISAIGGVLLSEFLAVAPGPLFILSSAILFIISLIVRKIRQ